MRRRSALAVEHLEARDTPARFGTPWPDGQNLTLSFAPDGTPIAGHPSDLGTLLQQLGPQARFDVLRAFQNWVAQANLNVGLVGDTGPGFGTGGPMQGDPRMGDIRIGGIPLAGDVLAITAPFNYYDNYSGDVVVNTAAGFGPGGVDLYTALMQESGHAFGVGNSPDPISVMYEYYQGPRVGLSAGDVASIRTLYGARTPDRFEGTAGNGTPATATRYTGTLTADLTTAADVDVYKFTAGLLTTGVTVNLRAAGLSLVTPRVELLDAAGHVLASAAATDPTANDVTLPLSRVQAGQTYYVRVSAARSDVFGVGSYQLDIQQYSLLSPVTGTVGTLLQETGLNDTLLTATSLLTSATAVGPQTEYGGSGGFGSSSDVDYYQITVPPSPNGSPVNLVTTVWGLNGAVLNSWVEVDDLLGHALPGQVVTADGGTTTIQVRGLVPGGTYFLRLASDTGAVGAYQFAADLRTDDVTLPLVETGTVSPAAPSTTQTLTLAQTGQVHFVLSADGASNGAAELDVVGADGSVAAVAVARGGRGRSVDVFLPAGTYQLVVRSIGSATVTFGLALTVVTDPVGPQAADPTYTPADPTSTTTTTSSTSTTTTSTDTTTTYTYAPPPDGTSTTTDSTTTSSPPPPPPTTTTSDTSTSTNSSTTTTTNSSSTTTTDSTMTYSPPPPPPDGTSTTSP